MMEPEFDPDRLKPLVRVFAPDPRNTLFAKVNLTSGAISPMGLADHHDAISAYILHDGVPEGISIQFETVKNIYLYAWFVYRFFTIAEHHAYSCLELALRERLTNEIASGELGSKRPGLRRLLSYAADHHFIRNEGFSRWRNRGQINSRHRVEMQKIREASEFGIENVSWNESEIEVTEEDLNWDYVRVLIETLPMLRNEYAHGSQNLLNGASSIIEVVGEIINQLFEAPPTEISEPGGTLN